MSDDATDWLAGFLALGFPIVSVAGYLIPVLVAVVRRHPKGIAIGAANFLLGGLGVLIWFFTAMGDRAPIDPQILIGGAIVLWAGLLIWAFIPFEKPKKSE